MMVLDSETEARLRALHLEAKFLELGPEEEGFFKAETGIQDAKELRKHIIKVHEEAYEVYPYPCIRAFLSVTLQVSKAPVYPRVLGLEKSRPDAIYLDVGCCLGAEVRKVVRDGWPVSQTVATDVEAGFCDLGHRLFRTTPETYPAKFLVGDVFDDAHLSPTAPVPSGPPSPITSVNSLTELRGRVSAIYASFFFHLFNEEKQLELGKRLAALLDPRPGSIIFGTHSGTPIRGQRPDPFTKMFCHSPESWTQMWEEQIFERGQVKVNAVLKELSVTSEGRVLPVWAKTKLYWLIWSVERL